MTDPSTPAERLLAIEEAIFLRLEAKAVAKGVSVGEFLKIVAESDRNKHRSKSQANQPPTVSDDGETNREEKRSFREVFREIIYAPDRSAGIVGGAFVESGIERLLRACWRRDSNDALVKQAIGDLFQLGRPLSTFSAKNAAAFLSRVVGPQTYNDLDLIREIRNKFAHSFTTIQGEELVSFNHKVLANWCNGLQFAKRPGIVVWHESDPPRSKFIITVLDLGVHLLSNAIGVESDGKLLDNEFP